MSSSYDPPSSPEIWQGKTVRPILEMRGWGSSTEEKLVGFQAWGGMEIPLVSQKTRWRDWEGKQCSWGCPRAPCLFLPWDEGTLSISKLLYLNSSHCGANGKEPVCQCRRRNSREVGLIPGLGRSPGGGCGNPLQYSCLENSVETGAWRATVHGVAQSQTRLNRLSMHAPTRFYVWFVILLPPSSQIMTARGRLPSLLF